MPVRATMARDPLPELGAAESRVRARVPEEAKIRAFARAKWTSRTNESLRGPVDTWKRLRPTANLEFWLSVLTMRGAKTSGTATSERKQ